MIDMMHTFLDSLFLFTLSAPSCNVSTVNDSPYSYLYENLPFEMPLHTTSHISDYSVSVADFGERVTVHH